MTGAPALYTARQHIQQNIQRKEKNAMTSTVPARPVRRSRLWLWLCLAIAAAGIGVLAGQFLHPSKPAGAGNEAVQTLFHTQLSDPAGTPIDLAQFRGKTVVVNFWASWCGPCVEEMPELTALNREYAQKTGGKVAFLGIGIDSASNIKEFLQKVPVDYPLAVAGFAGTELTKSFGNDAGGLPFTVVISPAGEVTYRKMGRITSDELRKVLPAA